MAAEEEDLVTASLLAQEAPDQRVAPESRPRNRLAPGTPVGRYVILDHLGTGGMGSVYRAWDPELDRPIALKVIAAANEEADKSFRERLLREAQALARLSHPNVVAVYDVGTFGNDVFMATELVEGCTLRQWLGEVQRSPAEICDRYLAAGEGLAAANRAGLVHRDFKPDKVATERERASIDPQRCEVLAT